VGTSESSNLLFISLKQHLGGLKLYNNKEVEKSVREWVRMQNPIYTAKEHLNPCQDGTNTNRCSGGILKNDNSLVQKSKNLAVDTVYNIRCADGLSVGFI
jgi:hypothetical protein